MTRRRKARESPRPWSLALEVGTLDGAVCAARTLAESLTEGAAHATSPVDTAHSVASVLALVHVRLRDISRMLAGDLEASALRAPHNALSGAASTMAHGNDVTFGTGVSPRDRRR